MVRSDMIIGSCVNGSHMEIQWTAQTSLLLRSKTSGSVKLRRANFAQFLGSQPSFDGAQNERSRRLGQSLEERVGFEPTVPFGTTVFKTVAIDHSATSPYIGLK